MISDSAARGEAPVGFEKDLPFWTQKRFLRNLHLVASRNCDARRGSVPV